MRFPARALPTRFSTGAIPIVLIVVLPGIATWLPARMAAIG